MIGRVLAAGLLAAFLCACSVEHQTVASFDACATYGLRPGSAEYWTCQKREIEARRDGRASAGASTARLMVASQNACGSYGLTPYTEGYERCVRTEYAYRQPA